jgi:hypothetical protein
MRTHRFYWRIWIAMLGLMLLLTACGGGGATSSTTGANGTSTPHATSTTPSSGSINTTSTVSFTASGGLTGTYTISDNIQGGRYSKSAFTLSADNQSWIFILQYSGYKGPGTYTFKYTRASPPWGNIELANSGFSKDWRLTPTTSCQMTVTSDTSLDSQFQEVKGSFSCPSLTSQSSSSTMLTLTNGHFDFVAQIVSQ